LGRTRGRSLQRWLPWKGLPTEKMRLASRIGGYGWHAGAAFDAARVDGAAALGIAASHDNGTK
jgi:hypothetical protein